MRRVKTAVLMLGLLGTLGCGARAPTDVELGQTSLIVWVNPRLNEANQADIAAPGSTRAGVSVRLGEVSATTDADGVAVLSPVAPGAQTLRIEGGGQSGELALQLTAKELRELAVALDGSGARVMAELPYRFGGEVVEVTPSMSTGEINEALNGSNRIVLLHGGEYTGDIEFNGSDVTLFGEGTAGGEVTVRGTVKVNGSENRIRGARIVGNLEVDGSNFGITSSSVTGAVTVSGSSAVVLDNAFCGGATLSGSGNVVLETRGLGLLEAPPEGC